MKAPSDEDRVVGCPCQCLGSTGVRRLATREAVLCVIYVCCDVCVCVCARARVCVCVCVCVCVQQARTGREEEEEEEDKKRGMR